MSPTKSSRGVPKQMGKISKDALLVAQEITFAKILSGNDPKVRERGIKRLQKWLTARSSSSCQFQESDLKRIWKGLFYCMWMSDKPLVQEEIAEHISNLVHCFQNTKSCICFVKCFFATMAVEWRGLDNWRMDKFLMFVRRFLRQVFVYVAQRGFPLKMVQELGRVYNSTILPDNVALSENLHPPLGFSLHFVDIYMDELTKVSKGKLNDDELLVALLRPFVVYVSEAPEPTISKQIVSQIFDRLIEQSEEGHKFREKFSAWKQLGFPRGNIDAVERVQSGDSDEEMEEEENEEEGVLDPRAGGVSVELPVADFNSEAVLNLLREYRHVKGSTTWSRKVIARLIYRFVAMTRGKYPLGIKKVDKVPKINFKKMAEKSAKELVDFQDRITYEDDDEWMESLKSDQKKSKAPKRSTNSDEDDDSEELYDDSEGSDEDVDEEEDNDDLGDSSEVDSDDENSSQVEGDADGDDDQDIEDAQNINVESDEDDPEGEDDLNVDVEDDGEEIGSEEDDEVEAEKERVKLSGKKNKKKQVVEGRPKKETPKNLPKVIPSEGNSKKQKNKQDTEKKSPQKGTFSVTPLKKTQSITPLKGTPLSTPLKETLKNTPKKETPLSMTSKGKQKHTPKMETPKNTPKMETPKNTPEFASNGISKKHSKQFESTPPKKEETVIIVGRKRKLSDAIATPVIQRGKQFKNAQHSPRTPQTPGSAKKVQFILQRNTAQATSEYDKMLRENPGNPYDSAKKPRFSVLKTTPLASPVNPFYKP